MRLSSIPASFIAAFPAAFRRSFSLLTMLLAVLLAGGLSLTACAVDAVEPDPTETPSGDPDVVELPDGDAEIESPDDARGGSCSINVRQNGTKFAIACSSNGSGVSTCQCRRNDVLIQTCTQAANNCSLSARNGVVRAGCCVF